MTRQQAHRKIASAACQACRKRRGRCVVQSDSTRCDFCILHGISVCDFAGRDRRRETTRELKEKLESYETLLEKLKTCSDDELAILLERDPPPVSASQGQGDDDLLEQITDRYSDHSIADEEKESMLAQSTSAGYLLTQMAI